MAKRVHEHADVSALSGEIRAEALERIERERAQYDQVDGVRPRRWLLVIGGANAILLLVAVVVVLVTRGFYDTRADEVTDSESRFVTTEWRILQELQQRTDRLLREKDREIQLLRRVQQNMRDRDATEDEYEQVRLQLQQAYAQREALLQARLSAPESELETIVSEIEQAKRTRSDDEIGVEDHGITVETMGAGDSRSLAWYRRVIDDLRVGRTQSALELLEVSGSEASTLLTTDYDRLYTLVLLVQRQQAFLAVVDSLEEELAERDRELEEMQQELLPAVAELESVGSEAPEVTDGQQEELRTVRAQYAAAVDELAAARSEIELLLEASETDLAVARSEVAAAVAADVTDEVYGAVESLLDYMSGVGLTEPTRVRRQLLAESQASERFRELIIRAQRLAAAGVDSARDDLPTASLVGLVTEATEGRVVAEVLTSLDPAEGSRIEFRSRVGVQPGRLLGLGRVDARAGDILLLSVTETIRTISVGDFVYASVPTAR